MFFQLFDVKLSINMWFVFPLTYNEINIIAFVALTFVVIADKIQKVPSAACVLDQNQRVLQDCRSVQQPRLPEG